MRSEEWSPNDGMSIFVGRRKSSLHHVRLGGRITIYKPGNMFSPDTRSAIIITWTSQPLSCVSGRDPENSLALLRCRWLWGGHPSLISKCQSVPNQQNQGDANNWTFEIELRWKQLLLNENVMPAHSHWGKAGKWDRVRKTSEDMCTCYYWWHGKRIGI